MTGEPLPRLFSALSAECDDLAARVERMHDLFATGEPLKGDTTNDDFVIAAQDIDFVQQHLAALADFLRVAAETTTDAVAVDLEAALSVVRLADLRDRLAGLPRSVPPSMDAGEFELL